MVQTSFPSGGGWGGFKDLGNINISDIDEWADGIPTDTVVVAHNQSMISAVGANQQDIFAWINGERTFGWILIVSFGGIFFGTRFASNKFSELVKLNK